MALARALRLSSNLAAGYVGAVAKGFGDTT
jgi:hypothetical protein